MGQKELGMKYPVKVARNFYKNAEIFETKWCHTNKEIIFILLSNKRLYKSSNAGIRWTPMTKRLRRAGGYQILQNLAVLAAFGSRSGPVGPEASCLGERFKEAIFEVFGDFLSFF